MFDYSNLNCYPQTFYFGNDTAQDYQHATSSLPMNPYDQSAIPEGSHVAGMTTPDEVKPFLGFPCDSSMFNYPATGIPNAALCAAQNSFNSGFLPASVNPAAPHSPWALQPVAQSTDYLSHSPAWPTELPAYNCCSYEQHIPVQMPELGYESTSPASPASDRAAYSRMTVSESPVPKAEPDDEASFVHRTVNLDDDSDNADPCYAELLRQCLLNAPGHTMSLRDLYAWVAEHSPKAKDPTSTGWKNSVRHNLSMNQGFEKVIDKSPCPTGSKHRSFWRLTEDAVLRGIQSTTRYRKGDGKRKSQRSNRHGSPDDKRVKSGAKGGQATRRLATRRAAAAARSNWSNPSRHLPDYRDEPYPTRTRIEPTISPSPITSYPIQSSPAYWNGMSNIQNLGSYAAPASCKIENDMDNYAFAPAGDQSWMAW